MSDYLETDSWVDHSRVAIMEHSKIGKVALWTASQDERFTVAIIESDVGYHICAGGYSIEP